MGNVPKHLWRFPTKEARMDLAKRFNIHYDDTMQDWEWVVSDSERIDEFLEIYESGALTEDERFVLMETILQSFEDLESELEQDERWLKATRLVNENVELHIYTLWYWATGYFHITPYLRNLFERHRPHFAIHSLRSLN